MGKWALFLCIGFIHIFRILLEKLLTIYHIVWCHKVCPFLKSHKIQGNNIFILSGFNL